MGRILSCTRQQKIHTARIRGYKLFGDWEDLNTESGRGKYGMVAAFGVVIFIAGGNDIGLRLQLQLLYDISSMREGHM